MEKGGLGCQIQDFGLGFFGRRDPTWFIVLREYDKVDNDPLESDS